MSGTYFYIHIPKTGGRSFEALLGGIFSEDATCPGYFEEQCVSPAVDFARYRFYRGHHSHFVATALPRDTKILTILRHPLARAMSTYEHILHAKAHYHHRLLLEEGPSLAQFARHPTLRQHIADAQTRILGRSLDFSHLRAMAAARPEFPARAEIFLRVLRSFNATAEELAVAQGRLERMCFVGLTERFEESCQRFLGLMGRPAGTIPRLNFTPAHVADRRHLYNAEDIAAVTEANLLDLKLYEFALQLFDRAR